MTHAHESLGMSEKAKCDGDGVNLAGDGEPAVTDASIGMLTSGLGAATEPGQVKVTNSWHLLWTTKLQTERKKKRRFPKCFCSEMHPKKMFFGRKIELTQKLICTLTLESLLSNTPEGERPVD